METKERHDVIVLAQASMAVLIPEMKNVTQPVLYSINSGVKRLKKDVGAGSFVIQEE